MILVCLADVTFNKAKEFIRECITAIQFSHPNVLGIIGVSVLREEGIPLMVLPYMCHGDVKSFLKSKRKIQMEPTEYPEVHTLMSYVLHCFSQRKIFGSRIMNVNRLVA